MLSIPEIKVANIVGEVNLPASKSISNRYLVIQALTENNFIINNLSSSNDTLILQNAIKENVGVIDFQDAGTSMRFYLAFAALKNLKVVITGSERLKKRPIAPLITALRELGSNINYLEEEGCLPVEIVKGVDLSQGKVNIEGSSSSQFDSALLLIAPCFTDGLIITQSGDIVSEPYINLTIDAMEKSGAFIAINKNTYKVANGGYKVIENVSIEADWSAATFIYAWLVVRPGILTLPGLLLDSIQGDAVTAKVFEFFGVKTTSTQGEKRGITISSKKNNPGLFEYDFTNTPDMFPAIVAVCAYLKIDAKFTGVKHLILKESNRILAMKENLLQTGVVINLISDNALLFNFLDKAENSYNFKSYNDHRIAMACSIFAFQKNITFDDETVVKKSFPTYWETFRIMGFLQ